MPGHQSLRLQNFTVFKDVSLEFCEGINVFVGENGTGKTHAMKVLYGLQRFTAKFIDSDHATIPWIKLFQTKNNSEIVRIHYKVSDLNLKINNIDISASVYLDNSISGFYYYSDKEERPVFVPSLDMISHTKGFISLYDNYDIDFDLTHRDIVSLLLSPEKRSMIENPPEILKTLEKIMGGSIEEEGERFYLKTPQGRHPMPLVADGMRKIATLYQLIKNGWLEPGAVLFWDEPETHLNPLLMDEIIQVLLELARSGVQIFLATHNYVILKELDLQATKEDSVRYFSFELTPSDGAKVTWTEDYSQITPNPIAQQFDSIYDRELNRSLGVRAK